MSWNGEPIPVRCEKCNQKTLIISIQDKYYCLNENCLHQGRLPTEPDTAANKAARRYYVRELEKEVLAYREQEKRT